jgi:hypothetical protein
MWVGRRDAVDVQPARQLGGGRRRALGRRREERERRIADVHAVNADERRSQLLGQRRPRRRVLLVA